MAQTVILAYNGTDNTHYRALCVNSGAHISFLAIQPTTNLLGISIGRAFQASTYVVTDSVWHKFAVVVNGPAVTIYANGTPVLNLQGTSSYDTVNINRIGNNLIYFPIAGGLAPSLSLAPSTSLAPGVVLTYDSQSNANGIIDEVQEYSRALMDGEIEAICASMTLYEALPALPLQDGFSQGNRSGNLRTSMEGYKQVRQRWTATPTEQIQNFKLTHGQTQIIEQYNEEYGLIPFNMTDPITGNTVEAIITEPPSFSYDGFLYDTNVKLEICP